jgi:hypothetical protein
MVIELGAGYIRFHTNGATLMSGAVPYEISNSYAEADLFDIHYVQSGDVLTLVHPSYRPKELRRLGATNWTLTDITFTSSLARPTGVTIAAARGESLNITSITKANPGTITFSSTHQFVAGDGIYISGVADGGMVELQDGFYNVYTTNTTQVSLKDYNTGTPINTTGYGTYVSGGSAQYGNRIADIVNYYVVTAVIEGSESGPSTAVSAANNLYINGSFNTISWTQVSGATRYNVYKRQSGLYGYVGQTAALSFIDNNIAPDMGITPPIFDTTFAYQGITSVPVTTGGSKYGSLGTGGMISSIAVTNGGSGYISPTLTVTDPTGYGATFTVTNNVGGVILAVTVVTSGYNYSNPVFYLNSTGAGAGGAVLTPNIVPRTPASVTLKVTDATGTGAILEPIITNGVITGVNVVNPGSGYTNPVVTVDNDGGGSGATFGTPTLSGLEYPGAVSYFEQRRVFAGSTVNPQTLWMTRSSTQSDMSYSIPVKDTDRISFEVAAREANTIRHVVPLTQLILLTNSAEWRVTSVNSDALTPTSISVRPQSYIGANNVQPSIVNNSLVYCAARGGHVRELGYSWQANGFITGDLSLRAAHLFDLFNIEDMAYQKSPHPILWFVSSVGKLLGLTYVPEEQIGSWHQHDTDGIFESVTCVAEGEEDHVYAIIRRTINGQSKRYVERMGAQQFDQLSDAFYVDSGLTFDGTNTGTTTITASGGSTWGTDDTITLTASAPVFSYPATGDVGDCIVLTDSQGNKYRLRIASLTSTTVATAVPDGTIPASLRNTATATWAWARDSVGSLGHLEGKTVSILADGAVMAQRVVSGGTVTLDRPATVVHVGLQYDADLQTLPVSLNIEGFGQGRMKNVNKAWLRVYRSSGIFVGPDSDHLVEAKQRTTETYGVPPELKSDEILIVMTPSWASSGQVYIRQSDPLPLTIVSMTLEIALGG